MPQAQGWAFVQPAPAARQRTRKGAGAPTLSPPASPQRQRDQPTSRDAFSPLFGARERGVPDRRREDLVRLAEWLLEQDVHELARKHQVRGAEAFGFKAQAARLETSYDEVGFAYEVYPAGQYQRRNLLALVMLTASGFELYERPKPPAPAGAASGRH